MYTINNMILEAAALTAALWSNTLLADSSSVDTAASQWETQSCAAAVTGDEIRDCLNTKLRALPQIDHEDMWDPNWIAADPRKKPRTFANTVKKDPTKQ